MKIFFRKYPKSVSTPFFSTSKSFSYFHQRKIIHNIIIGVQNWQRVESFLNHCWYRPSFDSPLYWKRAFGCDWCCITCQQDSYDSPNSLYHWWFFSSMSWNVLQILQKLNGADCLKIAGIRWSQLFNWLRSKFPRKLVSTTFNFFDESGLFMAFKSNSSTVLNFFNATSSNWSWMVLMTVSRTWRYIDLK